MKIQYNIAYFKKHGKEALYYQTKDSVVYCSLCPNYCVINLNRKGLCKNKINIEGKLFTLAYGNPCSAQIDPIEKKPLFHYFPKSRVFSISTGGCNFSCLNCQNHHISQVGADELENYNLTPEKIVETCITSNCPAIAFTYTEPTAFYEFALATAKVAKANGLKTILISNGYINQEPLKELSKYIDAANIDLKCFDDHIYKKLCGGSLQPVLNTIKTLKENNIWLEITNLIIPTWNDDIAMIEKMCQWLIENKFENVPFHFSRFSPNYKLNNIPSTPINTLEQAKKIAIDAGIKYVYIGNVYDTHAENTFCPNCSKTIIERKGFRVLRNNIIEGKCSFCGENIAGVWE